MRAVLLLWTIQHLFASATHLGSGESHPLLILRPLFSFGFDVIRSSPLSSVEFQREARRHLTLLYLHIVVLLTLFIIDIKYCHQMRTEGSRGLMITYDPPNDDDDDKEGSGSLPSASANQFPVNTQEICYINVRLRAFLLLLKLFFTSKKKRESSAPVVVHGQSFNADDTTVLTLFCLNE